MGWESVAWGLARISSRELSEWLVFAGREPIGDRRGDLQAAIVATVQVNSMRGKEEKAAKLDDFLPTFWDDGPVQSAEKQKFLIEQMRAVFRHWN